MYKRVLVAIDGSDLSRKAVQQAAQLAKSCDAKLTIVNAVSHRELPAEYQHMAEVEHLITTPREQGTPMGAISTTNLDAATRARLAQVVSDKILEQGASLASDEGVEAARVSLDTDPANAILDQATHMKADLIVIGSRGLGRLESMILGSVSNKVIQHATCSCLVVR